MMHALVCTEIVITKCVSVDTHYRVSKINRTEIRECTDAYVSTTMLS